METLFKVVIYSLWGTGICAILGIGSVMRCEDVQFTKATRLFIASGICGLVFIVSLTIYIYKV